MSERLLRSVVPDESSSRIGAGSLRRQDTAEAASNVTARPNRFGIVTHTLPPPSSLVDALRAVSNEDDDLRSATVLGDVDAGDGHEEEEEEEAYDDDDFDELLDSDASLDEDDDEDHATAEPDADLDPYVAEARRLMGIVSGAANPGRPAPRGFDSRVEVSTRGASSIGRIGTFLRNSFVGSGESAATAVHHARVKALRDLGAAVWLGGADVQASILRTGHTKRWRYEVLDEDVGNDLVVGMCTVVGELCRTHEPGQSQLGQEGWSEVLMQLVLWNKSIKVRMCATNALKLLLLNHAENQTHTLAGPRKRLVAVMVAAHSLPWKEHSWRHSPAEELCVMLDVTPEELQEHVERESDDALDVP